MSDATWAAVVFTAISLLGGGATALWRFIHSTYADRLATKDARITELETDNEALEKRVEEEKTKAETLRGLLVECQGEKERQQPVVESVESLKALTTLQGEKIAALEAKVESLEKTASELRNKLDSEVSRVKDLQRDNDQLHSDLECKDTQIQTYEKALEKVGVLLSGKLVEPVTE